LSGQYKSHHAGSLLKIWASRKQGGIGLLVVKEHKLCGFERCEQNCQNAVQCEDGCKRETLPSTVCEDITSQFFFGLQSSKIVKNI
jgi:hypothetical protein